MRSTLLRVIKLDSLLNRRRRATVSVRASLRKMTPRSSRMPVTHDDLPHPVPPIAYLRYKENWFFLILDQRNDVFGAIHVVGEPGFDRIRYSVNLRIAGELIAYGNQLPFPLDFAQSPELGDGRFTVRFVKA